MGCAASQEESQMRKRDRELKKKMKNRTKNTRKVYRIILLGAGESGKSTVMKQLRINYENGLKNEFVKGFLEPIRENLIFGMNEIWQALIYIHTESQASMADINKLQEKTDFLVNEVQGCANFEKHREKIREVCSELIKQEDFVEVISNNSRYNVSDYASYFMEHYERVCDENYFPTNQDVLNARVRTTGFHKVLLKSGAFDIELIDVGGQKCERNKWLQLFNNMEYVIFVSAISDYDLKMKEEVDEWRIADSLKLFQHMSSSALLAGASFILFLNKTDLFEVKIPKIPLSRCFNDYTGGPSVEKAKVYIEEKFREHYKPIDEKSVLYVYFTSANDPQSMQAIVSTIHQNAFSSAFQELGFT